MPIKGHCGKECSECKGCLLDRKIPCGPDCENLTQSGKIRVKKCLEENCDEIDYIFSATGYSAKDIIEKYGEVVPYPYDI